MKNPLSVEERQLAALQAGFTVCAGYLGLILATLEKGEKLTQEEKDRKFFKPGEHFARNYADSMKKMIESKEKDNEE